MLRARVRLLVLLFALAPAGALAGPLTSATWQGALPIAGYTVSTANGTMNATGWSFGGSGHVSLSIPTFTTTRLISDTPPVILRQRLGGSQTIAFGPGGAVANQAITGVIDISLDIGSGFHLFSLPLGWGVSATPTATGFNPLVGQVSVENRIQAWTTGFFFSRVTFDGISFGTFFTRGSNNLTASGGGTLTLIGPSVTNVTIQGAPERNDPSVVRLTLTFAPGAVPEPAVAALLLSGALFFGGRNRRHR